jgi:hypothetical protein
MTTNDGHGSYARDIKTQFELLHQTLFSNTQNLPSPEDRRDRIQRMTERLKTPMPRIVKPLPQRGTAAIGVWSADKFWQKNASPEADSPTSPEVRGKSAMAFCKGADEGVISRRTLERRVEHRDGSSTAKRRRTGKGGLKRKPTHSRHPWQVAAVKEPAVTTSYLPTPLSKRVQTPKSATSEQPCTVKRGYHATRPAAVESKIVRTVPSLPAPSVIFMRWGKSEGREAKSVGKYWGQTEYIACTRRSGVLRWQLAVGGAGLTVHCRHLRGQSTNTVAQAVPQLETFALNGDGAAAWLRPLALQQPQQQQYFCYRHGTGTSKASALPFLWRTVKQRARWLRNLELPASQTVAATIVTDAATPASTVSPGRQAAGDGSDSSGGSQLEAPKPVQPWTDEEVWLLKSIVASEGSGKWQQKADQLGTGRTAKSVHTRWLRATGGAAPTANALRPRHLARNNLRGPVAGSRRRQPGLPKRRQREQVAAAAPAAEEGEYEHERRLRMEANQTELDRLGLGSLSGMMHATKPAPKTAIAKAKGSQPLRPSADGGSSSKRGSPRSSERSARNRRLQSSGADIPRGAGAAEANRRGGQYRTSHGANLTGKRRVPLQQVEPAGGAREVDTAKPRRAPRTAKHGGTGLLPLRVDDWLSRRKAQPAPPASVLCSCLALLSRDSCCDCPRLRLGWPPQLPAGLSLDDLRAGTDPAAAAALEAELAMAWGPQPSEADGRGAAQIMGVGVRQQRGAHTAMQVADHAAY